MNRQKLLHYLNKGAEINSAAIFEISDLAEEYPYCQTLQILRTRGLKNTDDISFKKSLKKASVYAGDRKIMYDYLLKENLNRIISNSDQPGQEIKTAPQKLENSIDTPTEANLESGKYKEQAAQHDQEQIIDNNPLEEEILMEAIKQTSQLEVESSLNAPGQEALSIDNEKSNTITQTINYAELSFSDWLLLDRKSEKQESTKGSAQLTLIDKFIENKPQISPVKASFFSPVNMGKMSLVDDESFVTETLAKIYLRQGEYEKAIRAYKNLCLKFPEKKRYFAGLQKNAEDLKNKK